MAKLAQTFSIGKIEVAALSDGAPERALGGFFHGVDAAAWTAALGITDPKQPMPFNFGTFLLRTGTRTVLVDSGLGEPARTMGIPGGGELLERLAELGVGREDVDYVVHTHLHGDHCGWNVMTEGKAEPELTFPKAIIFVSSVELTYWQQSELDEEDRAKAARRAILPPKAAGHVATFDGEIEVTTGVTTVPTPGHTPGHTSIMVSSQGEHLLILGDAAHHPVHLEHHDWIPEVDLNPQDSMHSRTRLAQLAVEKDALITGGHFPILTLGRLRRTEGGFRWEAAER
jgi:glyoxylase-like metal-dependent hydrolase (beta-lactamase superfamily II)